MTQPAANLKATPLNSVHRRMKAKMVDFGGWDMPVQYSGIIEEHNAVRTAVGSLRCQPYGRDRGPRPGSAEPRRLRHLQRRFASSRPGRPTTPGLLYDHGGFVDDILVHKVDDDHFFICVNASNQEKDFDHINLMNRHESDGRVRVATAMRRSRFRARRRSPTCRS